MGVTIPSPVTTTRRRVDSIRPAYVSSTLPRMPSSASVADFGSMRSWTSALDPYTKPRVGRSAFDLATSVLPYLALLAAMIYLERVSVALALVLAVPAAGFLVRVFIVFHDCTHGSFARSRRANDVIGGLLGLLVWMPFRGWQHEHAVHHATAGDLERRGIGDITTLTVAEYRALPVLGRLRYRLFRNPVVMFGLGWLLVMVVKPRFVPRGSRPKVRNSVLKTDAAIALCTAGLCLALGWRTYLIAQGAIFFVAGAVGIWLFYVQHQFEHTSWQDHEDWRYEEAALVGSSYLRLPRVLQFFTGNIGFHHVHHLSVRIPNYNLESAHESTERLRTVPVLTIRDGLRATRLKLWDEERRRLVTFREARPVPDTP
jgi:omega-6 fatty acid desaturase (delta-12 desaturase)